MQFHSGVTDEGMRIARIRTVRRRRAIQAAVATGLVAMVVVTVPRGLTAQDDRRGRRAATRRFKVIMASSSVAFAERVRESRSRSSAPASAPTTVTVTSHMSIARTDSSPAPPGTARHSAPTRSTPIAPAQRG